MQLTEQLAALMSRLTDLQRRVGEAEGRECSDTEFARRFLTFSSTTLSRVRAGNYAGNLDRVSEQAAQACEEIESRLGSIKAQAETDRQFVRTRLACAVMASVQKARDNRGRRLVVVLAPTGAGKTAIGQYLAHKGAIYIEGRQSWRSSYKAFCRDVAAAAGRPLRGRRLSEADAETAMLAALKVRDGVLYIDEANTLGASTANALKLILNQTGYTVVIAAIPELWDHFTAGAENEVRQIVNRCQPILRWKGLVASDVRPFLTSAGLPADDLDQATEMARAAAMDFGALKTVTLLADTLREIDAATLADVKRELGFHQANAAEAGIRREAAR